MVGKNYLKKSMSGGACFSVILCIVFFLIFSCDTGGGGGEKPQKTSAPTAEPSPTPARLSIIETYPADDAAAIDINKNLYITFDMAVVVKTGNISLYKSDDTPVEIFDVTGANVTILSGTRVKISPTADFDPSTGYYILIGADSFTDAATQTIPFSGITAVSAWNFTTGTDSDAVIPGIDTGASVPMNGTEVSNNTTITIIFTENIIPSQTGTLEIHNEGGSLFYTVDLNDPAVAAWTDAFTLVIDLPVEYNFAGDAWYYIIIPDGAFLDYADNAYPGITDPAAWTFETVDNVNPSVTLSSSESGSTNANPIPVTVTFDEIIEAGTFTEDDLLAGHGTIVPGSLDTADNIIFTLLIVPDSDGVLTLDFEAGKCVDLAGNPNDAASQFSINYDGTHPDVNITCAYSGSTNISPLPLTIIFTEEVSGFAEDDIVVGNGSVDPGSLSSEDNIEFTVGIVPADDGTVTVDIASDVCADLVENGNTAATRWNIDFDGSLPGAAISSTAGNHTNTSPIPITITFTEEVIGFEAGDIDVINGTKGGLNSADNIVFTIDITPLDEDDVIIDIQGNVCQDGMGNPNTAALQFVCDYDVTLPGVTINTAIGNPTNVTPIPVIITFTEEVTGFDSGDLDVGNGTAGTVSGGPSVYICAITPTGQGLVTVNIDGGAAIDPAGNGNTAASELSRTFDSASPDVSITSASVDPTNVSPIPITITFTENVTGFVNGDLTVGNGSAGALSGGPAVYTCNITPSGQGLVTVNLSSGCAQDAANNGNTAAAQFSGTYDSIAPGVTITSSTQVRTGANPIPVTITFSEDVSGFIVSEITVGNGTAGTLSGGPAVYTCNITPTAAGAVTVNIAASVCIDAAGNGNTAAIQLSRTFITAIGYDTAASQLGNGVAAINFNITVNTANANRIVVAEVTAEKTSAGAIAINTVTIAGNAMTLVPGSRITSSLGTNSWISALYYYNNPATGVNNIIVTYSANCACKAGAVVLFDTKVHGTPDPYGAVQIKSSAGTTTISTSITTTAAYSMLVDGICGSNASTATAGSGQTRRWYLTGNGACGTGSTKPMAAAGTTTASWTFGTGQTRILQSVAEIKIAQ